MATKKKTRVNSFAAASKPELPEPRPASNGNGVAPAPAGAELIRGFRLLRIPFSPGSPITRGLLVKRHEARAPSERESAPRTLFVTHLDNFITEAQLSRCFSNGFGPVEEVELKSVEKKASKAEQRADHVRAHVNFARIIFRDAASREKALAAATGKITGLAVLPPPVAELKEQLRAQQTLYRDPPTLRREIDEWMVAYDTAEDEKKRAGKENLVDDDGFTKVVSGITRTDDGLAIRAAKRPAPKTGAFAEPIHGVQDPAVTDSEDKKKKKKREQLDFYKFQLREKKREELIDHRKRKFEDEEKVEYMKKKNKFKAARAA